MIYSLNFRDTWHMFVSQKHLPKVKLTFRNAKNYLKQKLLYIIPRTITIPLQKYLPKFILLLDFKQRRNPVSQEVVNFVSVSLFLLTSFFLPLVEEETTKHPLQVLLDSNLLSHFFLGSPENRTRRKEVVASDLAFLQPPHSIPHHLQHHPYPTTARVRSHKQAK